MKKLFMLFMAFILTVPFVTLATGNDGISKNTESGVTNSDMREVIGITINGSLDSSAVAFEENTIELVSTYENNKAQYKFVSCYNNGEEWQVISPMSNNSSVKWIPKEIGSYDIYIDSMDNAGKITTKAFKVVVKLGWDYTSVTMDTNLVLGNSYTVKPNVTGSTKGLSYKFVCSYNNGQEWTIIQNKSSASTALFTPKKTGNYEIFVDIMDNNGNVITKSVKVAASTGWSYNGISGIESNSIIGNTVTINPKVTGKTEGLSYKFVYSYNNWSEWGVIQPIGSNSTAKYTLDKLGEYEFYVDVTDKFGNVATKSIKTTSTLGWSFDKISNINSNLTVGDKITLSPIVTGKTEGLSYKFVYSYNNWSKWGVIQSAGSTASYTIDKAGTYEFFVDVTDKKGNVVTKSVKATSKLGWSFDSISGVGSGHVVGEAITVNPKVTGKTDGLSYKFVYYYDDWSIWNVIQPMSTKTTATYIPDKAGSYDIYVDISDKYGNVITKSIKAIVKFGWNYEGVIHGGNPTIGGSTTVTAKVSGKTTGLKYKFVYSYNEWQQWGVVQDLSTKSTVSFTPKKPGKYDIYVDVCDAYDNIITKSAALTVFADWDFSGITLSATDVDPGQEVTITPNVTGNTNGLQYKFVASYMDGASWTVINSFSSNKSVKYRIANPGHYDIYVDIMDNTGYTVTKSIRVTCAQGKISVINADWFSVIKSALPGGKIYTVVDVWTGKRFQVKSLFGTNHLDAEPLTADDTAVIKQLYGGKFSWDRRPVVVINGLKAYAGSMNGMPHDTQTITNNGFEGHFCIHFLNSRTHGSNKVDDGHQKAVKIAAGIGSVKL